MEANPSSSESERALLGIYLMDQKVASPYFEQLKPADWSDPRCREVAAVISACQERGEVPDMVVLSDLVSFADDTTPITFLLECQSRVHSISNCDSYFRTILRQSVRREAIEFSNRTAERLSEDDPKVSEIIGEMESKARSLATRANLGVPAVGASELLEVAFTEQDRLHGNKIPTGLGDLDQLLAGGYSPGDLVLVAGRPSMGKTTLSTTMLSGACYQGDHRALVSTLEASTDQYFDGYLHACSGAAYSIGYALSSGDRESISKYMDAGDRIKDQQSIWVTDLATSPRKLRGLVERYRRHNKIDLVVVDYIGLMEGDKKKYYSRNEEITEISRRLKLMAKELGVAMVVLSQLNRGVEARPNKRPFMSDLRDSGSLEQDADLICLMYRDEYYNPDKGGNEGKAEIIVAKNKLTGSVGTVSVTFKPRERRFIDIEEELVEGDLYS